MMTSKRNRRRCVRLGLCGLGLLAACGGGHGRPPAARSTITVLYPGDERILGPYWDMPAKLMMFLPLVRLDEHGALRGVLARRWEHSPDYRHWTIHLRSDVRWQDGTPFTARDVQFTWALLSDSAVLIEPPGAVDVEAVDDTTATFTYRKAAGSPLDTWQVYYPRHLLDRLDRTKFFQWRFWSHPVGDGPYRLVREVPKTMMELQAVPDYFAGRPAIDRMVIKFGEGKLAVAELLGGEVDALGWAARLDVLKLRGDPRFRVYYETATTVQSVLWNERLPEFANADVRRALTLAINRPELMQTIGLPADAPIVDGPTSERQLRRHEFPAPLPYDTVGARRLLDAAGWRDRNGDGVRDRNGVPFRFTLLAANEDRATAVYLQAALARVGVDARVSLVDISIVRDRGRTGAFDALLTWSGRSRDEGFFGPRGVTHYGNARATRLVGEAARTIDPDRKDAIYHELYLIFRREQPAMFVVPNVNEFVAPRWLAGLSSPWRADPIVNMGQLRIVAADSS